MTRQEGQWSTTANFAGGEQVGASWTDKVMALKATAPAAADNAGDDVIGDDEWVRNAALALFVHFLSFYSPVYHKALKGRMQEPISYVHFLSSPKYCAF